MTWREDHGLHNFNALTRNDIHIIFNNPCKGFEHGFQLGKFFATIEFPIINDVFSDLNSFDGWLLNDFSNSSELKRTPSYDQLIDLMLHNIHDNFENLYKPIDENTEFYDAIQNNSHPFGSKNKCAALLFHLSKLSSCSISENKYHKPFPNEVNVNMAEYIFISKLIFAWIKSTEPGSDAEFKLKMNAKSLIKLIQYTSFTSFVNDIPSNENIISAGKINERLKCGMLYSDNDKYLFSPYIVKSLSWDMFTQKTKETVKNVKLLDILQYLYEHDIRLSKGYGAISTPLAAYHDGYMCNFEALIQGYRYILWKHFHKFGFEHNGCNVSDMQSFLNSVLGSRRMADYLQDITQFSKVVH